MSAPLKPWEMNNQGRVLQSSAPMMQSMPGPSGATRVRSGPPALPPRPNMMTPMSSSYSYPHYAGTSYSPYGRSMGLNPYSSINSYGSLGGYGGMGGYGGSLYSGIGGMYGNNGYGFGPETRFIQMAEESTRPAFQGIESLVRAFGGVAMMLDSTLFAVQSSFRAVLGVAENFGRIRTMFGQLWSSLTIYRFLKWCYRKMLSLFGYEVTQDLGKAAWNEATREVEGGEVAKSSSWPIFMFLGMIVSAPYLISKLLPPLVDKRDPKNWKVPGSRARALYAFQASNSNELSLQPGDTVAIAPMTIQREMDLEKTGWVYVASSRGSGIVPVTYIQQTVRRAPANPAPAPTPSESAEGQAYNEYLRKLEKEFGVGAESSHKKVKEPQRDLISADIDSIPTPEGPAQNKVSLEEEVMNKIGEEVVVVGESSHKEPKTNDSQY